MRIPSLAVFSALCVATSLPAQLAGAYVVGGAGNYANLTAAISDLMANGVAGPVTFYLLQNETGPWTIGPFAGQGPANPVTFERLAGPVTISGAQPVLTLNGCASVTFRGLQGTFTNVGSCIVISGATTDCTFCECDFQAAVTATGGPAVFNFVSGSNCRIEDSTFGGSWQALNSAVANTNTTVERCRIESGGFRIMTLGGSDFTLVNNFISGGARFGINGGAPGNSNSGVNLKIQHNTIVIDHPVISSQLCSLRWYTSAAGTEVTNNIFVDNFVASSTSAFNVWCSGGLRPAVMDYNCFSSNQSGYTPVYASGNQTLAQWQGQGFDQNSIQADPLFVAPSAMPADLSLQPTSPCAATGTFVPAVLTDFFLAARTPAVSIGAHEQDSGAASYSVFGPGCAGSAGIPSNSISTPPQLGASPTITFGALPAANLAIALFGLSNTTSNFGPLPLPLGPFGAPGCFGRVSDDAALFLVGAGGSAGFGFPIPNQPTVLGFTFFTQAIVLDVGLNALGASFSDAAVLVVGV